MTEHEQEMRQVYAAVRKAERCLQMRHPDAHLARRVKQNGSEEIVDWCPDCERPVTRDRSGGARTSYSRLDVGRMGIAVSSLPEVRQGLRYRLCQRCDTFQLCEWHHAGPKELYGEEEADRMPLIPLCRPCHAALTELTRTRIAALRKGDH
jgi:hypothetical protein